MMNNHELLQHHDEIALLSPNENSGSEQDFEDSWLQTASTTSVERNRRIRTMSDLPIRLPYQKILFECFLLYSFGITFELIFRLIGPPKLGYFCNDLSISFTSRYSIINTAGLIVFVYCISFFPILFNELYRLLRYDPEICCNVMERGYNKIARLGMRLVVFFGYCQVAIVLTWSLTTITKFSVGRQRPYFLWMCNSTYHCVSNSSTEYVAPDMYQCNGITGYGPESIQEARLSFFSGHSSLSLAAVTYTALYLQARFPQNLYSGLLLPFMQFLIFASGLFVAYSRVVDHNHHPTDVLCGVTVGIIIASLVAKYVARLFDPPTEIALIKASKSLDSTDNDNDGSRVV